MNRTQSITKFFNGNKIVAGFVVVLAFVVFGTTVTASAAPDYFAVAKPSSTSQCQGGTWKTVSTWQYRHHWWHRVRTQVWTPNWEKLGFGSKAQCVNYVSTAQPTSKAQCDGKWRSLGFASKSDCERYLRLHPGSGYGGDDHDHNHHHHDNHHRGGRNN